VATLLDDTFTAADGTTLNGRTMGPGPGTWGTALAGTWQVESGAATLTSATANGMITADAGAADVTITLDCLVPASGNCILGSVVRESDASNGWLCVIESDGAAYYIGIYERAAGTNTLRASMNFSGGIGGLTVSLAITASGSTITCTNPGTGTSATYGSATSNQTVTTHGIYGFSAGGSYQAGSVDNFVVTGTTSQVVSGWEVVNPDRSVRRPLTPDGRFQPDNTPLSAAVFTLLGWEGVGPERSLRRPTQAGAEFVALLKPGPSGTAGFTVGWEALAPEKALRRLTPAGGDSVPANLPPAATARNPLGWEFIAAAPPRKAAATGFTDAAFAFQQTPQGWQVESGSSRARSAPAGGSADILFAAAAAFTAWRETPDAARLRQAGGGAADWPLFGPPGFVPPPTPPGGWEAVGRDAPAYRRSPPAWYDVGPWAPVSPPPAPPLPGRTLTAPYRLDNQLTVAWWIGEPITAPYRLDNQLTVPWSFTVANYVPIQHCKGEAVVLNFPPLIAGQGTIATWALQLTIRDREGGNVILTLTTGGGGLTADAPLVGWAQGVLTAAQSTTLGNAGASSSGRLVYDLSRVDPGLEGVMVKGPWTVLGQARVP
jgi:hypothetical protein